jgi:MIR domain
MFKLQQARVHSDTSVCSIVVYEGGVVMQQARSLWRLELARTKWAGGYINWYHPMRIRQVKFVFMKNKII